MWEGVEGVGVAKPGPDAQATILCAVGTDSLAAPGFGEVLEKCQHPLQATQEAGKASTALLNEHSHNRGDRGCLLESLCLALFYFL